MYHFNIDDSLDYSDMYFGKESFQTMLASEEVLGKDWNSPDEDKAWSYLSDRKE